MPQAISGTNTIGCKTAKGELLRLKIVGGWLSVRKGSARSQTKPIDCTRLKSSRQVDREGVLFWTNGSVAPNYTYPEQTPRATARHSVDSASTSHARVTTRPVEDHAAAWVHPSTSPPRVVCADCAPVERLHRSPCSHGQRHRMSHRTMPIEAWHGRCPPDGMPRAVPLGADFF